MTECICAIDQGTQSTRVYLFDKDATVVGSCQREFTQQHPSSGWTEHDAQEILGGVEECIEGALRDAKNGGHEPRVAGIGITNQRETTLLWDKSSGKPLHRAIVWHDSRTSRICHRLREKLGSADHFRETTGLPISPYFSAYKFRWLVENVEGVQAAVDNDSCFLGTIDTWLIWNLTGGPEGGVLVTDVSNASRTNLMELETQRWHEPTLDLFGIKRNMLAEIKSNAEVYGHMSAGPLKGVPIAGTKCVPSGHGLLSTIAYQLGKNADVEYALEGSIAVGGLGVRWLRDNLGCIESAEASEEVAASVPDTAGVFFVPAFSGLLAPHWQEDARGVILGLTSYTKQAHVVRAMLAAIGWQTKEVLDAMKDDNHGKGVDLLKVDGGASNNGLLMQIQADVLQIPVQRPRLLETTSLGAAYAAGVGVGFWDVDWVLLETTSESKGVKKFEPQADAETISKRYRKWQKAVSRCLDLADLTE